MSKNLILLGCSVIYSLTTSAQSKEIEQQDSSANTISLQEVVITGTRFEVPIEKSGKTIYKLASENIERNAGKTVADILNEVPGVQMEGNFGSPGTNISMYVRGGRNKNTLILIDGIPLNDPSGINASYDLRLLPVSQIESIEILKGGLSTLYGTGASAAVINITLKENKGKPIGGNLDFNYGSFNTSTSSGNIQGKINKLSYMLSGSYGKSDGFSSASDEQSTTSFGKDGFDQKNGLLKLGYTFNEKIKLDGIVAFDEFEAGYDDDAFIDADNVQKGNMLRFGLTPSFKYAKGEIQLKTMYAANNNEFISSFPTAYVGRNWQQDLNHRHQFTSSLTGLWGINKQTFSYEQDESITYSDSKFSTFDPYASVFYEHRSGFTMHLGGRFNTHSEYGSKFVYNLNPSYLITISDKFQLKLLASASTAYITPTGYQLFSSYGNKDLTPEESFNIEFGSSFYFNKSLVLNFVYFDRREENAIDFVSQFDGNGNWIGGAYENLFIERNVKGYEADLSYTVNNNLSFAANYAHASSDDDATFYRIPNDKLGASVNLSLLENTSISAKYNFTSKRTIYDFGSGGEVDLDSYGLVDIYAQQHFIHKKLIVYGAINNLLDKDFVSVLGFTTKGRNFNIGLKYNF
jgi:vitamin B12 transporter